MQTDKITQTLSELPMTIGQRITQIREAKGMRKTDLAKKLKVSDQLVNHYELQKDMKLGNIERIAKALGCTVHDIVCKRN